MEEPRSQPQDTPSDGAPDDAQHLANLKALVERSMEDGKLSQDEMSEIRAALIADGKITLEEMDVIRNAMKERLGDADLQVEPE